MLEVGAGSLRCDGREVAFADVVGFEEFYDPWREQARLRVRGAAHEEVIGPGYGRLRRQLRAALPDRPFVSAWQDGRFPGGWWGQRRAMTRAIGLGVVVTALALPLGVMARGVGVVVAVVVAWSAVVRVSRSVRITRRGVAAGPPWSPVRPWHVVDRVVARSGALLTEVEVFGQGRGARGTVPTVLLPALRARVRRLGGLEVVPEDAADSAAMADGAYAMLRPLTWGAAWGALVGGGFAALGTSSVWEGLGVAAMLALVGGLVAAAVEARSNGWWFGSVASLCALYAVALSWLGWAL